MRSTCVPFEGHSEAITAATSVSSVLSPDAGLSDGSTEGAALGAALGAVDGSAVVSLLGSSLGSVDGSSLGVALGATDGSTLGSVEGVSLGAVVGFPEFHGLGGGVIAPPKSSHPAHPSSSVAARISAKKRLICYSPISCSAVTPIACTSLPWNSKYSDAPSLSAFDAGRM